MIITAEWWGTALTFSGPLFIAMEGLSSLLVVQKLGQQGKKLVEEGEVYQFGLLITAAVTYVASAWWIVVVRTPVPPSAIPMLMINLDLPSGSFITTLLYVAGGGTYCFPLSHFHWICAPAYQHHRVLGTFHLYCLQRLALWL